MISAFILPIKPLIILVGFMIFLDTCTGFFKMKKKNYKFSSRRLSAILTKMFLYQGAVLLFYGIETLILGDFLLLFTSIPLVLTKVVCGVVAWIEIQSMGENIYEATGVNIWQRIKSMLTRAKEIKQDVKDIVK